MNTYMKTVTMYAAIFALATGATQATIIRDNNFNTDTSGFITNANDNAISLTGPESDISNIGGGSSVNLLATGGAASSTLSSLMPVESNLSVRIAFDLMQVSGADNSSFLLTDSVGTKGINIQFRPQTVDADLRVRENGVWTDTNLRIALNTWYHFEITNIVAENNGGNDTFDMAITDSVGSVVLSGTYDFDTDITSYTQVSWSFIYANPTAEMNIDNVVIETIPEPTSLSLLLLSATGSLLLRRIRS